jgi:uncharacterized protein YdeI (YjbR/CyaY-like superfamily)
LDKNASSSPELQVGFMKRHTGKPSMTWHEAVDEALCVGWIDGIRRRIDDERYQIRFTPRRARSNWSAVNIKRVSVLRAAGRMNPAGIAAFEKRPKERLRQYSYEQRKEPKLGPAEERRLKQAPIAWAHFRKQPPGCRRTISRWIMSAAKRETRMRRVDRLIEAFSAGKRLFR